jgi:hypothetical protein
VVLLTTVPGGEGYCTVCLYAVVDACLGVGATAHELPVSFDVEERRNRDGV